MCPFADESPDETEIAKQLFGDVLPHDGEIGHYREVFAARVNDDHLVEGSSSGGVTTWILRALLEGDHIDGVIHVGVQHGGRLFGYTVSHTVEELLSRRKSVYYSVTMVDAVQSIRGDGHRYALVGVPCFITAARHLASNDTMLREQLRYSIGLVCGHLKSSAFAELLAWQIGISPDRLVEVDFRKKVPGRDASAYDFCATESAGTARCAPTSELVGGNWGHGLFQLDACNFCDDVFCETADVVLADAWLPEFVPDWRGQNIVITRERLIAELLDEGRRGGHLVASDLSPRRAALSQAGNFRHRRDGLALRLHDDQSAGTWTPRKRVTPSASLPRKRREIVRRRRSLSKLSHTAYLKAVEVDSLGAFMESVLPATREYDRLYRPSVLRRLRSRLGRTLRVVFRRFR